MDSIHIIDGEAVAQMRLLPDNSVDHVITDPPYGVGYAHNIMGDNYRDMNAFQSWTATWAKEAFRVTRPGGWLIACSASRQDLYVASLIGLAEAGWRIRYQPLYWVHFAGFTFSTQVGRGVRRGFSPRRAVDMIIVASKDSHAVNYLETMRVNGHTPGQIAVSDDAMREYSHVFNLEDWWPPQNYPRLEVSNASRRERDYGLYKHPLRKVYTSWLYRRSFRRNPHPCPRPVKLMMYLLNIFSKPGDLVLDPFVGQGTTAHACYLMGRRFVGTELKKEFVDVARSKLKALRAAAGLSKVK